MDGRENRDAERRERGDFFISVFGEDGDRGRRGLQQAGGGFGEYRADRRWGQDMGNARIRTGGYRSAIAYIESRKTWIAVGTSGSDVSTDNGNSWRNFDSGHYNALSIAGNDGWAVGPKGAIARLHLPPGPID